MQNNESKNTDQLSNIEEQIEVALKAIEELVKKKVLIKNAEDLEAIEKEIIKATDKVAGLITAQKIQQSIDSDEMKKESKQLVESLPNKLKNQGQREVEICPSRGEPVRIKTSYFSKKSEKTKIKKKKSGLYPALFLLGIHDRCTPCLASEISCMATALGSFKETSQVLKDRGLEIGENTVKMITQRYAQRSKAALSDQGVEITEKIEGCRVVISTDGGRIRIRKNKRGPKTKKGRRRYSTDWREPKLLIIYTVNEKGEMDRSFCPFIEGTMKGPDVIFGLMKFYLSKLNIGKADKILFVADGARWIWKRVSTLMLSLGLSLNQFYELIDFYHAVEHLGKVAELIKEWKAKEKKRWVKKYRSLLLKGKVGEVVKAIQEICRGRQSKKLRREKNYFERNQKRMQYDHILEIGLPLGSGAMESTIRRVVNLRLKGASIYWLEATAEAMLMLRSYFKSGRWDMLKKLTFSPCLSCI
jgi:hypothetical protein